MGSPEARRWGAAGLSGSGGLGRNRLGLGHRGAFRGTKQTKETKEKNSPRENIPVPAARPAGKKGSSGV